MNYTFRLTYASCYYLYINYNEDPFPYYLIKNDGMWAIDSNEFEIDHLYESEFQTLKEAKRRLIQFAQSYESGL